MTIGPGGRGLRRGSFLAAVILLAVLAGCVTPPPAPGRAVRAYGDSILAGSENDVISPRGPGLLWYGDNIKAQITPASEMYIASWDSEPGQTMVSHSFKAQIDASGGAAFPKPFDVALLSFGGNDALAYARAQPGAYDSFTGKGWANYWMQNAAAGGASCIVWVLVQTSLSTLSGAQATAYTQWTTDFESYLRGAVGDHTINGATFTVKVVDWGAIFNSNPGLYGADQIHPSAAGATVLGQQIHDAIATCPAGKG